MKTSVEAKISHFQTDFRLNLCFLAEGRGIGHRNAVRFLQFAIAKGEYPYVLCNASRSMLTFSILVHVLNV